MTRTIPKIILTFMLVITLLASQIVPVYAEFIYSELIFPIDIGHRVEQKINLYADTDVRYSIVNAIHLNGVTNGGGYTLYELAPYGYAITAQDSDTILELCYESNTTPPLPMNDGNTYYYIGPASFAIASESGYTNIGTNEQLNQADVDYIEAFESRFCSSQQNSQYMTNLAATDSSVNVVNVSKNVAYDYFSNLSNFGYNYENTCTVLAISILLGYYDVHIYDGYVNDDYMDSSSLPIGTTEEFHQLLCDYVYGDTEPHGIQIYDAAPAITEYLSVQGLPISFNSPRMHNVDSTRNAVASLIDNGYPVVISSNPTLGATMCHSVVAYGYVYSDTVTTEANSISPNLVITTTVPEDTLFRVHYGHHNGEKYNLLFSSAWFDVYGHITDCIMMGIHNNVIESTGVVNNSGSVTMYQKKRTCCSCGYISYIWSRNP